MWSRSQPERIFTVNGISSAARIARTISRALAGSFISAEPPEWAQTFFDGQPMFRSTTSGPMSCAMRAASASSAGSRP